MTDTSKIEFETEVEKKMFFRIHGNLSRMRGIRRKQKALIALYAITCATLISILWGSWVFVGTTSILTVLAVISTVVVSKQCFEKAYNVFQETCRQKGYSRAIHAITKHDQRILTFMYFDDRLFFFIPKENRAGLEKVDKLFHKNKNPDG